MSMMSHPDHYFMKKNFLYLLLFIYLWEPVLQNYSQPKCDTLPGATERFQYNKG